MRYGATDENGAVLTPSTDDYGDASAAFENSRDLSSAFRVSWSVEGRGTPQITLSLLMQARTLGWVGFGLMSNTTAHGMIQADMWWGNVVDGVATVVDAFAESIQPPTDDASQDLFETGGGEDASVGITSLY